MPSSEAADKAVTPGGWAAPTSSAAARPRGDSVDELVASTQSAALALAPDVGKLAMTPMLKAIGEGRATVDLPLKPGKYEFKHIPFTVKPGTVAHIEMQVRNGELVSVGGPDSGTKATIKPPLDMPLWITGDGAELVGDAANQKFNIELGGMFDYNFKAKSLTDLLSVSEPLPPGSPPPKPGFGALVADMADFSNAKVEALVTMRSPTIDLGGAQVKVDKSSVFSIKNGPNGSTTFSGHVQLDEFGLDQGGVKLRGTGGQAELSATMTRTAEGIDIDSHMTGVKLEVDSLESSQPSTVVPGKTDHLSLGKTTITDGELGFKTRVGVDGMKLTNVRQEGAISMKVKGSGVVNDAQLSVKDEKDGATLGFAGSFEGALEFGPQGVKVDAKVSQAHVEVSDLQEAIAGNEVSIEHARVDGDLVVKSNSKTGQLSVDGQAQNIDILVDDFRGGSSQVKADLGKTSVTGGGQFHVGKDGVRADGRLKGSATIDSASFAGGSKGASLGASTISGELTHLNLGAGGPELKLDHVAASIGVKNANVQMGTTSIKGGGQVKGTGSVVLDAKGFSLQGKSQVGLTLDDGRLHSSTVDLDLAKGSTAELNITNLSIGKTTKVSVGPGTTLDAVIDSGQLRAGGQTVDLAKGGRAQLDIKGVSYDQGKVDLRGSLKLDARMATQHINLPGLEGPGLKLHPTGADGRVKVSVDDVHLNDNQLSFKNALLNLDLKVGKVVGASTPGQPGVGTLQAPVGALSVDEVKAKTAAQIAGVKAPAPAPAQPVDALRLLKQGELKLDVPLTGAVHALGMDVVKFPAGAKLDLSLAVKDGKIVANDTRATISGGVKSFGVELMGAHLDEHLRVHADVKIAGKLLSIPLPVHVPADMSLLAEQLKPKPNAKPSTGAPAVPSYFDLSHSQLDLTNATFGAGQVALPGGSVSIAEGSKLSFHGTPLSGDLVGNVGIDAVNMSPDQLALKGGPGRGDLKVSYHREGDKTVVDAQLSNLSMATDYAAYKDARGDYFSLGAGRITGATVAMRSDVAMTAAGLPRFDVAPSIELGSINVSSFSGDLKSARINSTAAGKEGVAELGASHLEGAVGYSASKGLVLKATIDKVDANLTGVQVAQQGRKLTLDQARLQGQKGKVEIGNGRIAFDAQQLAWDVTARELGAALPSGGALKANQTHITGQGRFAYDSKKDLEVDGTLHIDGKLSGDASMGPKHVTVGKDTGVVVR